jgi:hypothetical protein
MHTKEFGLGSTRTDLSFPTASVAFISIGKLPTTEHGKSLGNTCMISLQFAAVKLTLTSITSSTPPLTNHEKPSKNMQQLR